MEMENTVVVSAILTQVQIVRPNVVFSGALQRVRCKTGLERSYYDDQRTVSRSPLLSNQNWNSRHWI